jgi:hypothetical protein
MSFNGHTPFFNGIAWQDPSILVHLGFISKAGKDHIVCCYNDTKTDKVGEMCTSKHIHANPFEPTVCRFLAYSVFLLLKSLHLSEIERLFQLDGQTTAASQRCCG